MRQTLIANLIDTAGKEAQYDEQEEFDIKMTEEMEKEIKKMYALSEALKDRTRTETWQKAQTRIATNLLRGNNSIPFVAQMTELSEDVVRSIAKALKIESKK